MEHVRVPGHRQAKIGVRCRFPLIMEIGVVDAFEAHVSHATGCNILY